EVRAALDVERAVVTGAEGVVVEPDVGRLVLDVDGVVVPVVEGQVLDDDVVDGVELETAAGEPGAGVADDGGVGADVRHPREVDGTAHTDDLRRVPADRRRQGRSRGDRGRRGVAAAGRAAVLGRPADQAARRVGVAAPVRLDQLPLLVGGAGGVVLGD